VYGNGHCPFASAVQIFRRLPSRTSCSPAANVLSKIESLSALLKIRALIAAGFPRRLPPMHGPEPERIWLGRRDHEIDPDRRWKRRGDVDWHAGQRCIRKPCQREGMSALADRGIQRDGRPVHLPSVEAFEPEYRRRIDDQARPYFATVGAVAWRRSAARRETKTQHHGTTNKRPDHAPTVLPSSGFEQQQNAIPPTCRGSASQRRRVKAQCLHVVVIGRRHHLRASGLRASGRFQPSRLTSRQRSQQATRPHG
jgi:hypothetical protein